MSWTFYASEVQHIFLVIQLARPHTQVYLICFYFYKMLFLLTLKIVKDHCLDLFIICRSLVQICFHDKERNRHSQNVIISRCIAYFLDFNVYVCNPKRKYALIIFMNEKCVGSGHIHCVILKHIPYLRLGSLDQY